MYNDSMKAPKFQSGTQKGIECWWWSKTHKKIHVNIFTVYTLYIMISDFAVNEYYLECVVIISTDFYFTNMYVHIHKNTSIHKNIVTTEVLQCVVVIFIFRMYLLPGHR